MSAPRITRAELINSLTIATPARVRVSLSVRQGMIENLVQYYMIRGRKRGRDSDGSPIQSCQTDQKGHLHGYYGHGNNHYHSHHVLLCVYTFCVLYLDWRALPLQCE
jgi:hypothetical protein